MALLNYTKDFIMHFDEKNAEWPVLVLVLILLYKVIDN